MDDHNQDEVGLYHRNAPEPDPKQVKSLGLERPSKKKYLEVTLLASKLTPSIRAERKLKHGQSDQMARLELGKLSPVSCLN